MKWMNRQLFHRVRREDMKSWLGINTSVSTLLKVNESQDADLPELRSKYTKQERIAPYLNTYMM